MALAFDYIGIVTADLARSLAFYRALGLEIPEQPATAAHAEIVLDSGMRIGWDALDTIRGFDPTYEPPVGSARVAFAFQASSPAEVDDVYARLTALGHRGHVAPWDAFWGQRYATVLDPDGNGIDIYAALPAA